ncbi:hypothetical protein F4775DRAFT_590679 [Biscogniauxia sp. FL1348]|nr:hypothetical protein F4775DRAFT_590679 [Biscogniauxia sp. FL1348]
MPEFLIIPSLTMMPELERIIVLSRNTQPTVPKKFTGGSCVYNEFLGLLSLDDKKRILRYMGLNDEVIEEYQTEFVSDPDDLAVRYSTIRGHEGEEGNYYPLVEKLWEMATTRDRKLQLDLKEDYGGLMDGLGPEFAIFCGFHPSEESYNNERFRTAYYIKPYQEHEYDTVQK